MTDDVAAVLRNSGYEVVAEPWGLHNIAIVSIVKDGVEQIPVTARVGYDDPRNYLPADLVALLDMELPEDGRAGE